MNEPDFTFGTYDQRLLYTQLNIEGKIDAFTENSTLLPIMVSLPSSQSRA